MGLFFLEVTRIWYNYSKNYRNIFKAPVSTSPYLYIRLVPPFLNRCGNY
ncbi:UNVERIFIED_CONTAM: hypothetical protein GTU68_031761 [Idotea baltica]|nr:hypothetical protein [Idotea baltica]